MLKEDGRMKKRICAFACALFRSCIFIHPLTCRKPVANVPPMNRRLIFLLLAFSCVMLSPFRSPAPLIYTPGEGWTYEPVGGGGNWQRTKAKEQLIVAQEALDKKDYSTALKAAR